MTKSDIVKLVAAIGISELAGVLGSVFTVSSLSSWYAGLTKPAFNPPGWVFGPVWTLLYALMGVAAYLVWRRGLASPTVRIALTVFLVQLVLNLLWTVIFFGLKNPGAAFGEIIILWFTILATIVSFMPISKPAAWLLVPYIAWVSFASYLNYSIWKLN